jgi:hypothetical protein
LLKEPWKALQVGILVTVCSTNGNDGNIAIVNEDLKNCLYIQFETIGPAVYSFNK